MKPQMDLNKVMLIGRATNVPQQHIIEWVGTEVSNFSVATNRYYKDKDWNKLEEVEFHNISAFGNLATLLNKHVTKWKKIYVEWRMRTKTYTDTNGVEKKNVQIVAEQVIFLDNKKPEETNSDDAPY